jgi:hypothetical protein
MWPLASACDRGAVLDIHCSFLHGVCRNVPDSLVDAVSKLADNRRNKY